MDNIIFSANVVLPLLVMMTAGYITRRFNIIDDNTTSQCNSLAFKVFLPILLFNNTRNCTIETLTNFSVFIYVIVVIVLLFVIVTIFVIINEKDNKKRGVMIQGICRSNYALFGIPLITLLLPEADLSLASIFIAIVIPLFNIFSVTVLTIFGTGKTDVKSVLLGIVKNPLIIATALGISVMFIDIEFPFVIENSLTQLGDIASPFALFMLGARFDFKQISRIKKQLTIACLGRLIIVPAVVLSIAVMLGFRSVELACMMVIFGSPTAASSYTMAEKMGGDGDLASSIVVFTSVFSIITVFATIYILRMFGLF
ncbi:MAG: AEC family transporter [Clostridia bacterium]